MVQPKPIKQPRISSSLKRTGRLKRRTRIQPLGTRGRVWKETRKGLKADFLAAGITTCELRVSQYCTPDSNLGFAHARKRSRLSKYAEPGQPDHIGTVILACNFCHDRIEIGVSHAMMEQIVMAVIADRESNGRLL
jgi:hypothetical protein